MPMHQTRCTCAFVISTVSLPTPLDHCLWKTAGTTAELATICQSPRAQTCGPHTAWQKPHPCSNIQADHVYVMPRVFSEAPRSHPVLAEQQTLVHKRLIHICAHSTYLLGELPIHFVSGEMVHDGQREVVVDFCSA